MEIHGYSEHLTEHKNGLKCYVNSQCESWSTISFVANDLYQQ